MNNFPRTFINTGAPRSVTAHAISGGLVAGMSAGALEYAHSKDAKLSAQKGFKGALTGAIALGAGIYATNVIGNPYASKLNALAVLGLATAGIYMLEKGSKDV